jgi:DNA transformation protein
MAASREFCDFVIEQMTEFGPVETRRMFGGAGIFRHGIMFGLIAGDTLYLKADGELAPAFLSEGLCPFSYDTRSGKRTLTSYWRAPERCLDDGGEMAAWCRRSFEAASRGLRRPRR